MNKFQIVYSLFLLTLFASCQKESSSNSNNNTGTMTIEIDGVAQTTTDLNSTLISLTQNGEVGRRLDLRANIGSDMLIITVSNWDFQNPPVDGVITKIYDTNTIGNNPPNRTCTTRPSGNLCDGGLGTYTASNVTYSSENISNEPTGTITISQNNTTDKTVSGTFNFKVKKLIQPNSQPLTFTGTFSDLPYTVLN